MTTTRKDSKEDSQVSSSGETSLPANIIAQENHNEHLDSNKGKPFPKEVQGFIIHPDRHTQHNEDFSVHTTALKKLLLTKNHPEKWPTKVKEKISAAAFTQICSKKNIIQPRVGDIIFYDDGHPIITFGNKLTKGIKGTECLTHVSIVVDVNKEGTVLIAEAGGYGGVKHLRQSTISHLQSGIVFRPTNTTFAQRYTQIALDATKFVVSAHFHNIATTSINTNKKSRKKCISIIAKKIHRYIKKNSLSDKNTTAAIIEKDLKNELAQALVNHSDQSDWENAVCSVVCRYGGKFDKKSWGQSDYNIVTSAPYAVLHMLFSPLAMNSGVKLLSNNLFTARHNEGLRTIKAPSENSDFRPWCSRFALNVILLGYAEMLLPENQRDNVTLPLPKDASKWINDVFVRPVNWKESDLLTASPRELYNILLEAKQGEEHLFTRIGSFINVDDYDVDNQCPKVNARYNEGKPFSKNTFEVVTTNKTVVPEEQKVQPEDTQEAKTFHVFKKQFKLDLANELKSSNYNLSEGEDKNFCEQLLPRVARSKDFDDLLLAIAEISYKQKSNISMGTLPSLLLFSITEKISFNEARQKLASNAMIKSQTATENGVQSEWSPTTKKILLGLLLVTGIMLTLTGAFTNIGLSLSKFALEGIVFGSGLVTLCASAAIVKKFRNIVAALGLFLGVGLLLTGIFAPLGMGIVGGVVVADAMLGSGILSTALSLPWLMKGLKSCYLAIKNWFSGKKDNKTEPTAEVITAPALALETSNSTTPSTRRMSTGKTADLMKIANPSFSQESSAELKEDSTSESSSRSSPSVSNSTTTAEFPRTRQPSFSNS